MVRKKSDTMIAIEAVTTVFVVALPTPSAPPVAFEAVVAGDDPDEEGEEDALADAAGDVLDPEREQDVADVVRAALPDLADRHHHAAEQADDVRHRPSGAEAQ